MESQQHGKLRIRPFSHLELARLYEVCDRTFRKWIIPFEKEIGERRGRYYTITQVKIILEKLGMPSNVDWDS
jgi:hypothetical protein